MGSRLRNTHLVVFPFPAQGHINAALDLSRALASLADLEITFVCTEHYVSQLQAQGFSAGGLRIRLVGLPDGLPSEKRSVNRLDHVQTMIDATERMEDVLESLIDTLIDDAKSKQSEPPACIIYDRILWWICGVAKKFNIPAYIFFPMSAGFFSFLSHYPDLVSQGRLPLHSGFDVSAASDLFHLPGLPPLHASELPDVAWDPNPVCTPEYIVRASLASCNASGILINTVYELEKDIVEALRQGPKALDVRAIGPILPSSFLNGEVSDNREQLTAADRECLDWLDLQPTASVVYIAVGTIASQSIEQIKELATGLEASQHRFLWVVRLPPDHLSTGYEELDLTSVLPKGFEERMKDRGKVVRGWAPQRSILGHSATGGFITHCGWNSILESVSKGVPMLLWPMFADQGMNCKFLEKVLEVGKAMSKDAIVGWKDVASVVRFLMDDDNASGKLLRMKSSMLRQSVSRAVLPGGSSHEALGRLLEDIAHPKVRVP